MRIAVAVIVATLSIYNLAASSQPKKAKGTAHLVPFDFSVDRLPLGYSGQDFMTVFKKNTVTQKGEFETTDAFRARLATLGSNVYAFRFVPEEVKYDADQESFKVVVHIDAFYSSNSLYSGSLEDTALPVHSSDAITGHYVGVSGLGVRTRVEKDHETTDSLVVHSSLTSMLSSDKVLVKMDPKMAAQRKSSLAFLFVCRPAQRETGPTMTTTIHISPEVGTPLDRTLTLHYIFVDQVEVWVFDKTTGEVLRKAKIFG